MKRIIFVKYDKLLTDLVYTGLLDRVTSCQKSLHFGIILYGPVDVQGVGPFVLSLDQEKKIKSYFEKFKNSL